MEIQNRSPMRSGWRLQTLVSEGFPYTFGLGIVVEGRMIGKELLKYVLSVTAIAVMVLALAPFAGRLNSTTIALALLLIILFIAAIIGSRYALVASFASVLCFNYFFLPPLYTFTIADPENWIAFGAFVITALVAGQLSSTIPVPSVILVFVAQVATAFRY